MVSTVVVQRRVKGVELIKTTFEDGKKKVLYNVKTATKNIGVNWDLYSQLREAKGIELDILLRELELEA